MNDERFEQQLRAAFTIRLGEVSPDREARLRAFDYRPHRRRSRNWSRVTAAVMTAAAVAAALVLLLGSGAQSAFAGWTRVPVSPTARALATALESCGSVPASGVLADEARGPYTAIVYMHQGKPWQCVVKGRRALLHAGTPDRPNVLAKPAAGKASLPLVDHQAIGAALGRLERLYAEERRSSRVNEYRQNAGVKRARQLQEKVFTLLTGADSLTSVSGVVGRGVTGVTFVLHDGTRVQATVRDGWYLAWWPGHAKEDTDPVAIRVRTAAGTQRAPYPNAFLRLYYHPCLLDERCVRLETPKLVQGVAPALTRHFALFRETQPISGPELRTIERQVPGIFTGGLMGVAHSRLGLDVEDARQVFFGARGTIVVTPGTAGICLNVIDHEVPGHPVDGDGQGGCDSLTHDLAHGTFVVETIGRIGGAPEATFHFIGIVPDGNQTVTFNFSSGRTRIVRVKHNVVFAQFSSMPSSVTYKNANGKPAHWR